MPFANCDVLIFHATLASYRALLWLIQKMNAFNESFYFPVCVNGEVGEKAQVPVSVYMLTPRHMQDGEKKTHVQPLYEGAVATTIKKSWNMVLFQFFKIYFY